jgi:DNA polymerase V
MPNKKIAIVDCNNFYVSCERLFNPSLNDKPVAVLSNNDGCVIARSQEIKDLGVKMGQPVFKLDKDVKRDMVKFSSNYILYGDISDRISNTLKRFTDKIEVYSIDESFLDLSHVDESELINYITNIKSEILRLTGIPVSIGVGPNKTIAKLMNYLSKNKKELGGVCSYWDNHNIDSIDVDEVWGIGRKWKLKLNSMNVTNIGEFKKLQPFQVKKLFTVVGFRTWLELNGDVVYKIETKFKKPKVVTSSRSFGRTMWNKNQISDALWTFIEDCSKKLKVEKLKPRSIVIFLATNRFDDNYQSWSKNINIYLPTNDTQLIWNQISEYLKEIPFRLWAKAGVICYSLIDEKYEEPKLFVEEILNFEKPSVKSQMWMTRRDFLSKNFTTDWDEIPILE